MDRQQQYIQAYFETVKKESEKDSGLITRLVNAIENHMVTNMAKDQYLDMGMAVLNSQQELGDKDFFDNTGPGSGNNNFDEYYPTWMN